MCRIEKSSLLHLLSNFFGHYAAILKKMIHSYLVDAICRSLIEFKGSVGPWQGVCSTECQFPSVFSSLGMFNYLCVQLCGLCVHCITHLCASCLSVFFLSPKEKIERINVQSSANLTASIVSLINMI